MKNILLIALVIIGLTSCEKDDSQSLMSAEKPSITSVKFTNVMTGSVSHIKVDISLNAPEKGSVLRIDALRNTTRINGVVNKPETGTHTFTDNGASWPGANPAYYTFILVLKDGTETASTPYQVK